MKTFITLLIVAQSVFAAVPQVSTEVEALLRNEVMDQVQGASRIEIKNVYVKGKVPKGVTLGEIHPKPPMGIVSFTLYTQETDGKMRAIPGNALVRAYAKVIVSRAPIRHGDAFSQDNIQLEEREISSLSVTGFHTSLDSLTDLRANGAIPQGTVVGLHQTQVPSLIAPGQLVDLVYEKNNLRITAKVRSMEGGKLGQWIKVENPTTKRVLMGRVTASGQLSIR